MRGIVLAGGSGTRLYPLTRGVSKQLLAVYDKPMVYYPISVLMLAHISEILIITTPEDQPNFKRLLGDGSNFGINISYECQRNPDGIAQALIIGEDFIGDEDVCLVLGDNIFYGQNLTAKFRSAVLLAKEENMATVFGYQVKNPKAFGVVEFDKHQRAISIEEKPEHPKSDYAVTGIYFYPNSVVSVAKNVTFSDRRELEISSVNSSYLFQKKLNVEILGRGFAWFDTGTHESLMEASNFVYALERQQGYKIACLEEIAYKNGWLLNEQITGLAKELMKSGYGQYLIDLLDD